MSERLGFSNLFSARQVLAPALTLVISGAVQILNFSPVHAQTWTGTTSDSWSEGGNWSTSHPGPSSSIKIDTVSPNATVANGVTYSTISTLDIGKDVGSTGRLDLENYSDFTINPWGILTIGGFGTGELKVVDSKVSSARPGRIQRSSATVELKARISSAMASAGVFHPRVLRGLSFISRATSLSHV